MLNVLLHGACGAMGREVAVEAERTHACNIVAGIDRKGKDAAIPFPIYGNIFDFDGDADVIIDFSNKEAISDLLTFSVQTLRPVVIATTGLDEPTVMRIKECAKIVPVFFSYNMALSIALMEELVRKAAQTLLGFDIEIVEKHHRNKADAPSGTAKLLYKAAQEGRSGATPVYNREDRHAARQSDEIGIMSVRGGGIVGEHEVIFAGEHEIFTIRHEALSKRLFAAGALNAAKFLFGRPAGLYSVKDIIEERK